MTGAARVGRDGVYIQLFSQAAVGSAICDLGPPAPRTRHGRPVVTVTPHTSQASRSRSLYFAHSLLGGLALLLARPIRARAVGWPTAFLRAGGAALAAKRLHACGGELREVLPRHVQLALPAE